MKYFLLFTFTTLALYPQQNLHLTHTQLSEQSYWHSLLHFREGESEIDDPKFFLAKNGKTSPKAELDATIEALKDESSRVYCDFPARREWLLEQIPELQRSVKSKSCNKFNIYMKNLHGDKLTLVFPTAHINSPASMFGHTLLRIDRSDETALTSIGVNYAAFTNENNGMAFAFKGLVGLYAGKYATIPYYKKIKEYNALENRDIWEYTLNLEKEEIRRLLLHLYEIKDTYSSYYFFKENCSYNMLWLLQIARPSVNLMKNFNYLVPPLLTIRDTYDAKMVESIHFRHSKLRLTKHLIGKLENRDAALDFEASHYNKTFLKAFSKEQQSLILDIAINRLQYKRSKGDLEKGMYLKDFLLLLGMRSKVMVVSDYKVPKPSEPLTGHYLTRVSMLSSAKGDLHTNVRLSYHDKYDLDKGFHIGAYINFFNFDFSKKRDESFKVEKIDFLNIASYAVRDSYFKPYSWEVNVGLKRWDNEELYAYLDLGVGFSYGDNDTFVYAMLKPTAYVRNDTFFGIGGKVGFISSYFDDIKLGGSLTKTYFDTGLETEDIEVFTIIKLTPTLNLNLNYSYDSFEKNSVKFGLNYYLNI